MQIKIVFGFSAFKSFLIYYQNNPKKHSFLKTYKPDLFLERKEKSKDIFFDGL